MCPVELSIVHKFVHMLPIYLLFVHVLITHSSSYTGHRVYGMSETLQPVNAPITMDVFYDHIYQRRPFLARHGSQRLLDKNLEWNTQQWFDNANYLVEIVWTENKSTSGSCESKQFLVF